MPSFVILEKKHGNANAHRKQHADSASNRVETTLRKTHESVTLILFPSNLSFWDLVRGYCPKCKEYRSDNGKDAWSMRWHNDLAICERCGSVVDLWMNKCQERIIKSRYKIL